MMRFTAFSEIQLNPDMRDIGNCRWAKPIRRATITPIGHISPVTPIPLVSEFNRVSRKAVIEVKGKKRIAVNTMSSHSNELFPPRWR
jgi:hypothetical protein